MCFSSLACFPVTTHSVSPFPCYILHVLNLFLHVRTITYYSLFSDHELTGQVLTILDSQQVQEIFSLPLHPDRV